MPGALFNGALQQSGSTVTGTGQLTVIPALLQRGCPIFQTANLHGTFSASRHLSLTSDPLDGDVLQLELDVPADPHAGTTGTLAIAGPCALAKTTAISLLFEPLTGTYTGMVQAFDPASPAVMGAKLPATVTVSETDPDATGVSTVSGTAHVTLASCTANLPFQFRRAGGLQSFDPQTAGIAPPVPSVVVAGAPLATTLGLTVAVQPDCSPGALLPLGTEYLGTLTRQ